MPTQAAITQAIKAACKAGFPPREVRLHGDTVRLLLDETLVLIPDDAKGDDPRFRGEGAGGDGIDMTWNTDTAAFAAAVAEFERRLPGFWWTVGQCSVGAHASCAVDGNGSQAYLLEGLEAGHCFDRGFHADTDDGSPAEALRAVMDAALAEIADHP